MSETPQQLEGRQVLRNFGRHGTHRGTITSLDDEEELTFRVEYEDGDCEDLAEDEVRLTLLDKTIKIGARSRRHSNISDSESDYIDDEAPAEKSVSNVTISSQATTQPMETSSQSTTQPRPTPVRRRPNQAVRQRSSSTLWVACPCPVSISVHSNAVDRGLCAQTLREHHTILERAMVRIYPRFKWGRSHYLQVQPFFIPTKYIITVYCYPD
jgi:hypothetical protein